VRLAQALRDALPADAITILDGNLVMEAMEQTIPVNEPASRLTPGASGISASAFRLRSRRSSSIPSVRSSRYAAISRSA
jgi:2-hydroxyacyl-CoA lyase 1